eukprot:TRINITY_DN17497_c0_g1_i1.p2 TRINITY_DN17497_c0_g1~~TRINITY_DN17497_c0_g1_i1.p2  ORF type:complete len:190 (-),score=27.59 TRINITY_DN17497_c0_g1_i1:996-1565(-)
MRTYERTAPPFSLAWKQFELFIRRLSGAKTPLLISHNAYFHLSIVEAELARDGMRWQSDWHFGCSLELVRTLKVESKGYSKSVLAAHFGIDVDREPYAEADILVVCDILKAIEEKNCDGSSKESGVCPNCVMTLKVFPICIPVKSTTMTQTLSRRVLKKYAVLLSRVTPKTRQVTQKLFVFACRSFSRH